MENSYALQVGQLFAKKVSKVEDLPFTPRTWAVILDFFQRLIKPPEPSAARKSISIDLRIEHARDGLATFIYSKEQRGFVVSFADKKNAAGMVLKGGKVALISKEANLERLLPSDLEFAFNYYGNMSDFLKQVYLVKNTEKALVHAAKFCIEAIKTRHTQKLSHGSFGLSSLRFQFRDSRNACEEAVFSTFGTCKEFSKHQEYKDIQNLITALQTIYAKNPLCKEIFQKHLLEIFSHIQEGGKSF